MRKSNVEQRHSPIPWGGFISNGLMQIAPAGFQMNVDTGEQRANAAFIVKAVNNHEALVEACNRVLSEPGNRVDDRTYELITKALAQVGE